MLWAGYGVWPGRWGGEFYSHEHGVSDGGKTFMIDEFGGGDIGFCITLHCVELQ